jgi:hypothetical protein
MQSLIHDQEKDEGDLADVWKDKMKKKKYIEKPKKGKKINPCSEGEAEETIRVLSSLYPKRLKEGLISIPWNLINLKEKRRKTKR